MSIVHTQTELIWNPKERERPPRRFDVSSNNDDEATVHSFSSSKTPVMSNTSPGQEFSDEDLRQLLMATYQAYGGNNAALSRTPRIVNDGIAHIDHHPTTIHLRPEGAALTRFVRTHGRQHAFQIIQVEAAFRRQIANSRQDDSSPHGSSVNSGLTGDGGLTRDESQHSPPSEINFDAERNHNSDPRSVGSPSGLLRVEEGRENEQADHYEANMEASFSDHGVEQAWNDCINNIHPVDSSELGSRSCGSMVVAPMDNEGNRALPAELRVPEPQMDPNAQLVNSEASITGPAHHDENNSDCEDAKPAAKKRRTS